MAVEEARAAEFFGGIRAQVGAGEASEAQWLDLTGFVLDNERRLRSQWPAYTRPLSGTFDSELGAGGRFVAAVGKTSLGATTLWAATVDVDGGPTAWVEVAAPAGTTADHRPICRIPVKVGSDTSVGLLFGEPSTAAEPFVLYRTAAGAWATKTWANVYPSGAPSTNAMPVGAGVGASWGDYLVLGDIQWLKDDNLAFSASNVARLVNGLWFSGPGEFEEWDPINVEFVSYKSSAEGQNQIIGLFEVEQGMMVFTTDAIALLRGTPSQHTFEVLRTGISPQSRRHVTAWPSTGSVAWVDADGRVWQSNGEQFFRVDREVEAGTGLSGAAPDDISIAAAADFLMVSSPDGCWVLTSYGEAGAWTRLAFPDPAVTSTRWRHLFAYGLTLFAAADGVGWVTMPVSGGSADRGTIDGTTVLESRLLTRTLPGGGHERTFWHRHGVRAVGSGSILSATAFPSVDGEGVGLAADGLPTVLAVRGDLVVPAHGPSLDATFEYRFSGDVTVESTSVWFHKGRAER